MMQTVFHAFKPYVILLPSAAGIYVAALAGVILLTRRHWAWPGLRAIGHCVPVAAVAGVAMHLGHPEVAINLVYGTSVAALSGVIGVLALAGPIGPGPLRRTRVWPFVLPASLLVFVSGFNGLLDAGDAAVLVAEGTVLLALWLDRSDVGPLPGPGVTGAAAEPAEPRDRPATRADWGLLAGLYPLTLALAIVAGTALVARSAQLNALIGRVTSGAVAATIVSIALAAPMIFSGRSLMNRGLSWVVMSTQVGVVLINLCFILPMIILWPYMVSLMFGGGPRNVLPYPLAVWRIDAVVLILLSLAYVPVATGRWTLSRREGMALILIYGIYVITAMTSGMLA